MRVLKRLFVILAVSWVAFELSGLNAGADSNTPTATPEAGEVTIPTPSPSPSPYASGTGQTPLIGGLEKQFTVLAQAHQQLNAAVNLDNVIGDPNTLHPDTINAITALPDKFKVALAQYLGNRVQTLYVNPNESDDSIRARQDVSAPGSVPGDAIQLTHADQQAMVKDLQNALGGAFSQKQLLNMGMFVLSKAPFFPGDKTGWNEVKTQVDKYDVYMALAAAVYQASNNNVQFGSNGFLFKSDPKNGNDQFHIGWHGNISGLGFAFHPNLNAGTEIGNANTTAKFDTQLNSGNPISLNGEVDQRFGKNTAGKLNTQWTPGNAPVLQGEVDQKILDTDRPQGVQMNASASGQYQAATQSTLQTGGLSATVQARFGDVHPVGSRSFTVSTQVSANSSNGVSTSVTANLANASDGVSANSTVSYDENNRLRVGVGMCLTGNDDSPQNLQILGAAILNSLVIVKSLENRLNTQVRDLLQGHKVTDEDIHYVEFSLGVTRIQLGKLAAEYADTLAHVPNGKNPGPLLSDTLKEAQAEGAGETFDAASSAALSLAPTPCAPGDANCTPSSNGG